MAVASKTKQVFVPARSTIDVPHDLTGTTLSSTSVIRAFKLKTDADPTSYQAIDIMPSPDSRFVRFRNKSDSQRIINVRFVHNDDPAVVLEKRQPVFSGSWAIDTGRWKYYQHRQYAVGMTPFIDNLIANPDLAATHYNNRDLQQMLNVTTSSSQGTVDSEIATYISNRTKARSIGYSFYPALRMFPNQNFVEWTHRSHWEKITEFLEQVLPLRNDGDRRICLDCESYKSPFMEPSDASLASYGLNRNQVYEAMEPLIDVLKRHETTPVMYPAGPHNVFMNRIVEELGVEKCELWTEYSIWMGPVELVRIEPNTEFDQTMMKIVRDAADLREVFSNISVRHLIDDDIDRIWGKPARDKIISYGEARPWIFDLTRKDRASNGTREWISGSTLSPINGKMQYVWSMSQLGVSGEKSVGVAPTASMHAYKGDSSSLGIIPLPYKDAEGVRLTPHKDDDPKYYRSLRISHLPVSGTMPWTVIIKDFQIPSTVTSSVPLFGQATVNFGGPQVYFDNDLSRLVLQMKNSSATASIAFEVLPNVQKDTDVEMVLGRSGSVWFYWAKQGDNESAKNRVDVGFQAPHIAFFELGMGQEISTYPRSFTAIGCKRMLFKGMIGVMHELVTDAEIDIIRTTGSLAAPYGYPFNRGALA